jgi:protein TonB
MKNSSLIFFTAFSVAAHAALIGLWPASNSAPLPPQENTIEIGMVTRPPVNTDFTQDRNRPKDTASLKKKNQSAQKPATDKIQEKTDSIHQNETIQAVAATSNPEPSKPTVTTKEEISALTAVETSPHPDTSPVTATRSAPLYSKNPAPEYPANALLYGWEGEVWLRVTVDRSGAVSRITIEQSSNHQILDQAAVRTVKRWQFLPARIGDETTVGSVRIPIRFQIERS